MTRMNLRVLATLLSCWVPLCTASSAGSYIARRHRLADQMPTTSTRASASRSFGQDQRIGAKRKGETAAISNEEGSARTPVDPAPSASRRGTLALFSSMDALDKRIFGLLVPLLFTFSINPLISSLDLFWVNRLGDTLAVAGQSAANQLSSSAFMLFSFLPSVTATLVATHNARGEHDKTQDAVCQAIGLATILSVSLSAFFFLRPEQALGSILARDAPAMAIARKYLRIRSFSFLPMMMSFVGFSALRATLDVKTGVLIALTSNVFSLVLDPILIHVAKIGITGSAMATLTADLVGASLYFAILKRRDLIKLSKLLRLPSFSSIAPLLKGGLALQLRSLALNVALLRVARVVQSIDDSGVAASANALVFQTTMLGGILLGALSTVAQTLIPHTQTDRTRAASNQDSAIERPRLLKRLMKWSVVFGLVVTLIQLIGTPGMLRSSPLPEVRDAARLPMIVSSLSQVLIGPVMVGEGIMIGTGRFWEVSMGVALGTLTYLAILPTLTSRFGLAGVWSGFSIFTLVRLASVLLHQRSMLARTSQSKRHST